MTELEPKIERFIVELRGPDDTVGISPSCDYDEGWVDAQEQAADELSDMLDEHGGDGGAETYVVTVLDKTDVDIAYVGQDADAAKAAYDETISGSAPPPGPVAHIGVWVDGERQYKTLQHPDETPQSLTND